MNLHGPFEQTWTTEELDFTQGTILKMDNSSTPHMATVQARPLEMCLNAHALQFSQQHCLQHLVCFRQPQAHWDVTPANICMCCPQGTMS